MSHIIYIKKYGVWIRVLTVIITIILFYIGDFLILLNEAFNNDITTHIILVPFIIVYLIYRLRYRIYAAITINDFSNEESIIIRSTIGVFLCILAYVLKLYGSYSFHPLEYHIFSLPFFLSGIILILFNYQTLRELAFPLLFSLFLMPPPIVAAQQIGALLSTYSSEASYNILQILQIPVTLSFQYGSPIIYLQRNSEIIPFAIDLACSGLYSLIGMLIFSSLLTFLARTNISRKLLVFTLGFPLIYLINIIRITSIILIGHFIGASLALEAIHLMGGWFLIFAGTFILIGITDKYLKINYFDTYTHNYEINQGQTAFYNPESGLIEKYPYTNLLRQDILKIFLVIVLTLSFFSTQLPVFTLTESAAEITISNISMEPVRTDILPEIPGFNTQFVYRDSEFEEISNEDAALMFRYKSETSQKDVWVGFEIASSKYVLHPWEVCLINYPVEHGQRVKYIQLDLRDLHLLDNPPISARFFVNKEKATNVTQVILYWYTKTIFYMDGAYSQKWVKISLIQYITDETSIAKSEAELFPIAKEIAEYWKPISKWSWLGLTIAEKGLQIISLLVFTTFALIMYVTYNKKTRIRKNQLLFSKIKNPIEMIMINALVDSKDKVISDNMLKQIYEKNTGILVNQEEWTKKLDNLEISGIIYKKMIHVKDIPHMKWGTYVNKKIINTN